MRNFEQRISEIDRRSKEIFRKRKKVRKQILAACVPIVLCTGLCFLLIPPSAPPSDSITPPAVTENHPGHKSHGTTISTITQIEITCDGQTHICTDPAKIQNIHSLLMLCTTDTERGNGGDGSSLGNVPVYTITLTMQNGETTRYVLAGTTLTAAETNQVYPLTPKQAEDLQSLLETPNL